jgi:hypothetical protein
MNSSESTAIKYVTNHKMETSLTVHNVVIDTCIHYIMQVYHHVVLYPLAKLYMYGPTLNGWGFWGGQDISHICAQKTSLDAEFWKHHPHECIEIIGKNFYAFVILMETLIYFRLLLYAIQSTLTITGLGFKKIIKLLFK